MTFFLSKQMTCCIFSRSNLIVVQGSPADMFKAIDENGDGSVSFDEWLGFAYKNYQVGGVGVGDVGVADGVAYGDGEWCVVVIVMNKEQRPGQLPFVKFPLADHEMK